MATLSQMFPWRDVLSNVKPDTLIGWHRKGFRLFWCWKSKPTGRPRLPKDLQQLIRQMAADNATWGEERIANELKLKLGIEVSPRTVGKYLRSGSPVRTPDPKQRWLTFIRNHAQGVVACDFFVVVTAQVPDTVRILDHGIRHPQNPASQCDSPPNGGLDYSTVSGSAAGRSYVSFLIHDRDSIFSKELDNRLTAMGVRVLRTPVRAPKANSLCERLGGTLRRECLDFLIPFNEHHLRFVLKTWIAHFNHARPHMSLGPGIPAPLRPPAQKSTPRHAIPAGQLVILAELEHAQKHRTFH
jgi:putative transposase